MNTIDVIAVTGIKVPMEGKPHTYITDAEPVSVEDSSYYQRRIADRDLVLVETTPNKKAAGRSATASTAGE